MTKEQLAKRTSVVVLLNLILIMTRLVPYLEKERWLILLVLPAIFATLVVQGVF